MKKSTAKSEEGILWNVYKETCDQKALQEDSYQKKLLVCLQSLYHDLETPRLFPFPLKRNSTKGLYIWGEVGRGKTFLMDLFFNQVTNVPKRRVHFHTFMDEIHIRLQQLNEVSKRGFYDLTRQIGRETKLLCFDEFQVTNIADALILARLFEGLFQQGIVVVATSNTEPQRLYENGLQRELFLPFISLLPKYMQIFHLQGKVDYRRLKLATHKHYYTPCNETAMNDLQSLWSELTDSAPLGEFLLNKNGPSVILKGLAKGIAWASFDDLCRRPCGKREYTALAGVIHTLILWGIPRMGLEDHNEAARFTILIDILYEKGIKLLAAAEVPLEQLYYQKSGFERTISRLYEMQHG